MYVLSSQKRFRDYNVYFRDIFLLLQKRRKVDFIQRKIMFYFKPSNLFKCLIDFNSIIIWKR